MSIELRALATARIQLRPPIVIEAGPFGSRQVFEVASAEFTGERFTGTLKGVACADWLLVAPDGAATLDIRGTLETVDGAIVYINYYGKGDFSGGGGSRSPSTSRRASRRATRATPGSTGSRRSGRASSTRTCSSRTSGTR